MKNVLFVKLPLYVTEWTKWMYRSKNSHEVGILLPESMHKCGRIIYERAVNNPMLLPIATLSFTQRAMGIEHDMLPLDMARECIPTEYSCKFYTAFILPERHIIHGTVIDHCDTMQLLDDDAKEFADILEKEMMDDLKKFQDGEWNEWATRLGYDKRYFQRMLECWCTSRDISPDNCESLLRVLRRAQEHEGNRPIDIKRRNSPPISPSGEITGVTT